jgi:sterol desaturase/sphingolipid hydroxylase (fatty acid hydroxylase superfamily)
MIAPLVVFVAAIAMMSVEAIRPGRHWPRVAGWWLRAALLNSVQTASVLLAGVTYDRWLRAHRPWAADGLGLAGGALTGYLAITFIYYWWHRWRHASPLLWRWLHQVHHSAQRIEVATSFYKHPAEILANGLLSSAILYLLVGLAPPAAALAVALTGLAELFYHWNVATPRWLGYVVQRPESHCVHHEQGLHAFNYSDLPLWDMLFGTFRNPARWDARCGFGGGGERRLLQMLRGLDVSAEGAGGGR